MYFNPSRQLPALFCLALLIGLASCHDGGSKKRKKNPLSLDAVSDATAAGTEEARFLIDGSGGTAWYWTDIAGMVSHSQFVSKSEDVAVRLYFDDASRLPHIVEDLVTGEFTTIEVSSDSRVDFLRFSPNGTYLDGFATILKEGAMQRAEILGAPVFQGQILGQLSLDSSNVAGSYVLLAEPYAGLGTASPIDPVAAQLLERIASGLPGTEPEPQSVLIWAGLLMGGPEEKGLSQAMAGASGIALMIGGLDGVAIGALLESSMSVGDDTLQEWVDLATMALANAKAPTANEWWNQLLAEFMDEGRFTSSRLDEAKHDMRVEATRATDSGFPAAQRPLSEPQVGESLPQIDVVLIGQSVWQDGCFYPLQGVIDTLGAFSVNGLDGAGSSLAIDAVLSAGFVSGSCDRDGANGEVDGSSEELGECNSQNTSGGQGSFSFAHFIGQGTGEIDFWYDALAQADAFIVSTHQGIRYSTGGPVSGTGSHTITIDDEPIVLISIYAPESGTIWHYSLGCLQ